MTENTNQETGADSEPVQTDGGVAAGDVDYLDIEVNILKPSTSFMRDHLKMIWAMFIVWIVIVFGPVTATFLATDFMTATTFLGFPLHYFLTATGAPLGAWILAFIYARRRDKLDDKYGIDHGTAQQQQTTEATAADGGVDE